jgi:cyclic pyranopterin phosphate synthase
VTDDQSASVSRPPVGLPEEVADSGTPLDSELRRAGPGTDSFPAAAADAVEPLLYDAQGRRITYVRLSLTDRCNFRCRYCMPPEGIHKREHRELLSLEELAALIRTLVTRLGIEKVRITGGEPLIRRGVIDFVTAIAAIPGLRDLSMTTNAYLLAGLAADLYAAGIHRLNTSLDSLKRERFEQITLVDGLAQVLEGIERAREIGFSPIKLNTVIMRENLDEAADIVRFAIANDLQPRFIELMPSHEEHLSQYVAAGELRAHLTREFRLDPVAPGVEDRAPQTLGPANAEVEGRFPQGPDLPDRETQSQRLYASAKLYRIDGGQHTCGFITPVSAPFCHQCNRIRVRADGHMMPCLSEKAGYDLKAFIRPVLRETDLVAYLREVMAASKRRPPAARRIQGMWRIGG